MYKTVHNKTTSYVEIRNHVSFKTTFKIKSKKREKHENSMFSSLGVKDVRPRDVVGSSFPQLEKGKNGRNAFRTGAKIYFSEKNILGLGALE